MKKSVMKTVAFKGLDATSREGAAEVVGLRSCGNRMEVAGDPAVVTYMAETDRLVGIDVREGRQYYFIVRENAGLVLLGHRADGVFVFDEQALFPVAGNVTGMASAGELTIFGTSEGLKYLHYVSGKYSFLGGEIEMPSFAFGVKSQGVMSLPLQALELSGDYPAWTGSTLTAADDNRAAGNFRKAVVSMLQSASRRGSRILPMLLRVGLRLWDDSLMWSGEMAAVGQGLWHPDVLREVAADADGNRVVGESVLTAEAWKPSIAIVSSGIGAWKPFVKAVEIYACDVDDSDFEVEIRKEQSQTGSPSCFLRMSATWRDGCRLLSDAAEMGKFRLLTAITDIEAFLQGKISGEGVTEIAAGTWAVDAHLSGAEIAWSPRTAEFSPKVFASAGGYLAAGNLTVKRRLPPHFLSMCDGSRLVEGMASTFVAVTLATPEGEAVVTRSELTERYSEKLTGCVGYPDARAIKMEVIAVAGGKSFRAEIALRPSSSGNFAFAVSTDGFMLSVVDAVAVPESSNVDSRCESALFVAPCSMPMQWQPCEGIGSGSIIAVSPSFRYGSSWTLGRSPLCLFSADGVRLLSFDSRHRFTAATLISRHVAPDGKCICPTAAGLAFADTHGEVCRYEGSKVVSTGIVVENVVGVGYSVRFDEIWVLAADGVVVVDGENKFYRRRMKIENLVNSDAGTILCESSSLLAIEEENERDMEIELRSAQIPTGGLRLKAVEWDAVADKADARFAVYGENGHSCHGELLSRLRMRGQIGAPFVHRVVAPRVRDCRLEIKGVFPAGTAILPARLFFGG